MIVHLTASSVFVNKSYYDMFADIGAKYNSGATSTLFYCCRAEKQYACLIRFFR
jgi:hypothetical protein